MADITITTTEVGPTSDTITSLVQIGEAVTAGDFLYLKTADSKYWLATNTTGTEEASVAGMALNNGTADDYVPIAVYGTVRPGNTSLTLAEVYVLSASGAMSPAADGTTGDYCTPVLVTTSASEGKLLFKSQTGGAYTSDVQRP